MKKQQTKNSPLISIIILAGINRRKELFRCLDSIYESSYKNFEIIVLNNSTDPDLITQLNKNYPDVRTIELIINTGIYGFNVGFANAKGDYILGIDDDCGLRKNTLQNIVDIYASKQKEVKVITTKIYNPLYKFFYEEDKDAIINRYSFADGASVFKREVFEELGYYDETFFCWQHSDDFSIRLLSKGYKIHFDKNIIIDHYMVNVGLRKIRAYLDMRNSVWFNLKHFSLIMLPLLIARNLVSLIRLPIRHRSLVALIYGLTGYTKGWLTFYIPLKKRHVAPFELQKKFLKYYLFNQHPQ